MKPSLTRIVSLIASALALGAISPAYAQENASAARDWSIAPATQVAYASAIAQRDKERIVVWNRPNGPEPAAAVYLLIDAPFAEARPAVERALAGFGRFETSSKPTPLVHQFESWGQVLLSRRPDLLEALAEGAVRPRLQRDVDAGRLTREEMQRRMQLARVDITLAPSEGYHVPAFQQTYSSYFAFQKRRSGFSSEKGSELRVNVFDVTAWFGHPATAVKIAREDTFANPYLKKKRDFNVLSSIPSIVTRATVPASLFESIHAALKALRGGETVQVALSPKVWIKGADAGESTEPARAAGSPSTDPAPSRAHPSPAPKSDNPAR